MWPRRNTAGGWWILPFFRFCRRAVLKNLSNLLNQTTDPIYDTSSSAFRTRHNTFIILTRGRDTLKLSSLSTTTSRVSFFYSQSDCRSKLLIRPELGNFSRWNSTLNWLKCYLYKIVDVFRSFPRVTASTAARTDLTQQQRLTFVRPHIWS